MYFSSRRRKEDQDVLEDNVNYPEATVKEYLNLRRSTKDKCCLVSLCMSVLVTIMLMGIGLFYGNYTNIGIFVNSSGNVATITADCPCKHILKQIWIANTHALNNAQRDSSTFKR